MNPQIAYGEDVITRATAILTGPDNDVKLQRAIIDLLNQMILELSARNKIIKAEYLGHDRCGQYSNAAYSYAVAC